MPSYFQTWNIPGSYQFDYIYFVADSRKQAEKIAAIWIEHKENSCCLDSDIANGNSGQLVSLTQSKTWRYQGGREILNVETGREAYYQFCHSQNLTGTQA